MSSPLFCAIDTPDLARAEALARAAAPHVGGIKLGLEFFNANGRAGIERLLSAAGNPRLFLDLKLHDIPNTVAGAVRALEGIGFDVLTVHAGGGGAMMGAAREAAPAQAKLVGVTVLTSLDDADLVAVGVPDGSAAQVARLADLARAAGLDGIVCSPLEVAAMRRAWPDGFFVVPGIRPMGSAAGDQKRTMTPAEALTAGADLLVVGRPITEAADPGVAAAEIAASLR